MILFILAILSNRMARTDRMRRALASGVCLTRSDTTMFIINGIPTVDP